MPLSALDTAAIARFLAPLGSAEDDLVEAYFEDLETIELPAEGEAPGLRVRRERGLAVRLVRGERSWMAARDRIDAEALEEACRQVARSRPQARHPLPPWTDPEPKTAPFYAELDAFGRSVHRGLRERRVGFPLRLTVRSHRRDLQVVTPFIVPGSEREQYYSVEAEMPWGRTGTLSPGLGVPEADRLAERLVESFRAREAEPLMGWRGVVVLGAEAAAIFLHEAVAHALEADTLGKGGSPVAAVGVKLAGEAVDVIDDPSAAPPGIRRQSDDEGHQVQRRWLLRRGVVEQPLADRRWANRYEGLEPGAGRRPHRHLPPGPRSSFLQLLPGDGELEQIIADVGTGIFVPEADRGVLDPRAGVFSLRCPHGRWIRSGELAERVGPCELRGRVADLLGAIGRVGGKDTLAGAGWCAKAGGKLPVWARVPPILVTEVELAP